MKDLSTSRRPNWHFGVYSGILPTCTPEEAVSLVKNAGYDGIQWRVASASAADTSAPPSLAGNNRATLDLDVRQAEKVKTLCRDADLAIAGLASYVRAGDLDGLKALPEMAVSAAADQVRIFPAAMDTNRYQATLLQNRRFLEVAAPLAAEYGVGLAVQIHWGSICPSASLMARLVAGFDPNHVGVIFDPGNMAIEGYEDYRIGLELLHNHVRYVYLKNARPIRSIDNGRWTYVWADLDVGIVDIRACLAALRDAGYTGWVADSDFSQTRPPAATLAANRAFLEGLVAELEGTPQGLGPT